MKEQTESLCLTGLVDNFNPQHTFGSGLATNPAQTEVK